MSNEPIKLEDLLNVTEGQYPDDWLEQNPLINPNEPVEPPSPEPIPPTDPEPIEPTDPTPEPTPEPSLEPEPEPGSNPFPITPEPGDDPAPEPTGDPVDNSEQIKQSFEFLKSIGYLKVDDEFEFDGSTDKFKEAVTKSYEGMHKDMFDSIWNNLDEKDRNYFNYKLKGGNDSMSSYIEKTAPIDVANLDIDSVENQRQVVKMQLQLTTKMKEGSISRIIDNLEANDELATQAEESLEILNTYKTEIQDKRLSDLDQQKRNLYDMYSTSIKESEFIPEERKNKVVAFMNNEVTRRDGVKTDFVRKLAQVSQSPEHLVQLADLLLDSYDPKVGFDFSRYSKQSSTKKIDSFQKNLDNIFKTTQSRLKSPAQSATQTKEVDWQALLNGLPD